MKVSVWGGGGGLSRAAMQFRDQNRPRRMPSVSSYKHFFLVVGIAVGMWLHSNFSHKWSY